MADFSTIDKQDDFYSQNNDDLEILQDEKNSSKILDIFMQLYQDNLKSDEIALVKANFERNGAVIFLENTNNYEYELGVLIDPDAYIEAWVCLLDESDDIEIAFARFLLSKDENIDDIHIIWGSDFNLDEFLNDSSLNELSIN